MCKGRYAYCAPQRWAEGGCVRARGIRGEDKKGLVAMGRRKGGSTCDSASVTDSPLDGSYGKDGHREGCMDVRRVVKMPSTRSAGHEAIQPSRSSRACRDWNTRCVPDAAQRPCSVTVRPIGLSCPADGVSWGDAAMPPPVPLSRRAAQIRTALSDQTITALIVTKNHDVLRYWPAR